MGYVRNTYGCHCYYGDNAFKRYNRAAIGDTVIFNYNSNNTYNCCGGHGGGFLKGLGLGIGIGFGKSLGDWCGGLFGGFSNIYGGFERCNMFGGFPSWGGFGMPSWFGLGGKQTTSQTNPTASTVQTVTVDKTNADLANIQSLSGEVADLIEKLHDNPNEVTQDDINTLKNKIQTKLNGSFDGIQDDQDKDLLSKELKKLDNLELNTPESSDLDEIISRLNGETPLTEDDLNKLIDGFARLSESDKNALKANLSDALQNYLIGSTNDYKIPRTYSDLLKMELLCKLDNTINVIVEKYQDATDKWIKGPIQGVTKDGNNISYWVNCETTGTDIKAQWRFTTQENSDTAKITGTIANENNYTARIGMTYNYNTTEGVYINNNNKVTGTTR